MDSLVWKNSLFLEMEDIYDNSSDGYMYNIDEPRLMDDTEGWTVLQTLLQNILEIFSKLESSFEKGYEELSQNIHSEEKQDLCKTERLLQDLKSNWLAKCKEADDLRLTLKTSTQKTLNTDNDYNEMKDSISKMRQQFGQAIDSNVTEMEELSIVNKTLSERVEELESKIIRCEKFFKEAIKENVGSLLEVVASYNTTSTDWLIQVKAEAEKLDNMMSFDDLFAPRLAEMNTIFIGKGTKIVEGITLGLVESLKLEVNESRKIINNQKCELKELQRGKEEFILTQVTEKDDNEKEISGILDYLRTVLMERNSTIDITSINSTESNIQIVKKMIANFNHNLTNLYENMANKANEMIDLNESITYLNEQIKNASLRTEFLEDENHTLRKKSEQSEANYQLSIEELNTIQTRLKRVEEERIIYIDENMVLKGKKIGIQGQCVNLNDENETLLHTNKYLEEERDKMFKDLHEQIKKVKQYSSKCKELEYKSDGFERTISKLRREYNDVTREMNMATRENEELKKSIQDSERDRVVLRRNIKLMETNNKDLEDQLSQLNNENHKSKHDYEKIKSNLKEYSTMIKELEEKIIITQNDINKLKTEKVTLEQANKSLRSQLSHENELSEKNGIILSGYEKLLIKLFHQRKEIISLLHLDKGEGLSNISLKISSAQSIEYKLASEIENSLKKNSNDIDSSFNSISLFLQTSEDDWKDLEHYYRELLHCIDSIDDQDIDSCYSTDGELIESLPRCLRRDIQGVKSNLNVSNMTDINSSENMMKLMNKIRILVKRSNLTENKLTGMKRTSRKSKKVIRQLQLRLKNRRTLECKKRNKILYLKRKLKFSKAYHNAFFKNYSIVDDVTTTPVKNWKPEYMEDQHNFHKLSESLTNAEDEIKSIRISIGKTPELKKHNSRNIEVCLSTIRDTVNNNNWHADGNEKLDTKPDKFCKRCNMAEEQRKYMFDHLKFTNKRLEVLLKSLQGREVNKQTPDLDTNNNYAGMLLKRVRDSFKSDEDIMKRAVDVLELTKAISMTDLEEMQANKAIDEDHLETIVLVKKLNENMESVLREARAQASEKNSNSESTFNLVNTEHETKDTPNLEKQFVQRLNDTISKPGHSKHDNELRTLLENAQKRVDNLSEYLKQREDELKERDEIIAKLYKEYEDLKQKASEKNDTQNPTSERIIMEYANAKDRLEKENAFLQLVVKEVREELLNLQKGYRREEETQVRLQELVNELQISKLSLEHSLDKMASELNVIKRDRDYLLQSLYLVGVRNVYQDPCYGTPYSARSFLHHNMQKMCDKNYYPEYGYYARHSESSAVPFSDEDWVSTLSCEDCDSVISDHDNLDIISSSDSPTTTCSKYAINIKTEEASKKIKSKNRPLRYLKKETRTRKPFFSPLNTPQRNSNYDALNVSDSSSVTQTSSVNSENRVLGRRERNMWCDSRGSSFSTNSQKCYNNSTSVTSQESSASSPGSSRTEIGHIEIKDVQGFTTVYRDGNWNDRNVSQFINAKYDGKKRKKKFLQFGKK